MEDGGLPSPPDSVSDLKRVGSSEWQDMELECLICCEDVDESNAVAFLPPPCQVFLDSGTWFWRLSPYCETCIGALLARQFDDYVRQLESVTCEREQRNLLARGPPINLHDCKAFQICEDSTTNTNTTNSEDNSSNSNNNTGYGENSEGEHQQVGQNVIETNTDGGHREVYSLYYFSDRAIHSAKVEGSLEGEARAKFIDEKRNLVATLNEERRTNS